jgi:hypothetical protein
MKDLDVDVLSIDEAPLHPMKHKFVPAYQCLAYANGDTDVGNLSSHGHKS